jgi:hypothetical protein
MIQMNTLPNISREKYGVCRGRKRILVDSPGKKKNQRDQTI